MKKNQKKKVYVTVLDGMIAIAAKAVLSEEQFKKASANKERIAHLLDGTNVELWFVDESKKPYNLGIRSCFMTSDTASGAIVKKTTSEMIAKEEEDVKNILDLLIERIDKFPENKPEKDEGTDEANDVAPGDDEPSDDNEKFIKSLAKDVEGSLKQHFGEDVEYALFVSAGSCVGIDSTIHPLKIIHMMAYAEANQ